jgi:hypothetical protein
MIPETGEIVRIRSKQYLLADVIPSKPAIHSTLVCLSCLNDDAQGEGPLGEGDRRSSHLLRLSSCPSLKPAGAADILLIRKSGITESRESFRIIGLRID